MGGSSSRGHAAPSGRACGRCPCSILVAGKSRCSPSWHGHWTSSARCVTMSPEANRVARAMTTTIGRSAVAAKNAVGQASKKGTGAGLRSGASTSRGPHQSPEVSSPPTAIDRGALAAGRLSPGALLGLQRTAGNRVVNQLLSGCAAPGGASGKQYPGDGGANAAPRKIQRVDANRVEYQHNRKVETDDKGHVQKINAPIDISFEGEEHSTYFAAERGEDQLTGLRTVRWEMDDDWWAAAKYHAYQGKEPGGGKWRNWYDKIEASHGKRMAASDGASLTTQVKKSAPHFDAKWQDVLNQAILKGTGKVEDTETEMRQVKAERREKAEATRDKREMARISAVKSQLKEKGSTAKADFSAHGKAWYTDDPTETWECSQEEAQQQGAEWEPL